MGAIVVGYDDSECARAALDVAIGLAKELGDSLVLCFAAQAPGRRVGDELDELSRAIKEIADEALAYARERVKEAGLESTSEVVAARVAEALLQTADKHEARMVVVGTYSEGPVRAALIGSTPFRLMHTSSRPVLVVPVPT